MCFLIWLNIGCNLSMFESSPKSVVAAVHRIKEKYKFRRIFLILFLNEMYESCKIYLADGNGFAILKVSIKSHS